MTGGPLSRKKDISWKLLRQLEEVKHSNFLWCQLLLLFLQEDFVK